MKKKLFEQAYDLFLAQAADNLDVADQLLFNLQFEERGAAEVVTLGNDWQFIVGFTCFISPV